MSRQPCSSGSARPADAGPLFGSTWDEAVTRARRLGEASARVPEIANMPAERLRQVLKQHQGKGNAITSRQLAQRLGISTREVREIIAEMVEDGVLIGASVDGEKGGFYTITTAGELEETRAILRSRAQHIFARDAALRRTWQREHGQELQPLLPQLSPE